MCDFRLSSDFKIFSQLSASVGPAFGAHFMQRMPLPGSRWIISDIVCPSELISLPQPAHLKRSTILRFFILELLRHGFERPFQVRDDLVEEVLVFLLAHLVGMAQLVD